MTSLVAPLRRSGIVRGVAAWLLRWRARCSGRRVGLVVCYHKVGDPAGNAATELVPSIRTQLFRGQLRHLQRCYRVVPLSRLREVAATRRRWQRFPLAITFDDDLASHLQTAAPELKALGLPASFFVCGASLSAPFCFWWEDLQRLADRELLSDLSLTRALGDACDIHAVAVRIELLEPDRRDEFARELHRLAGSWPDDAGLRAEAVQALAASGFEVGFHTRRHHPLTTLDDDQLRQELQNGRDQLAVLTGQRQQTLAYPHGKADERVVAAARRAGFSAAFTTAPTPVASDADPHLLGRVDASPISLGHLALALARTLRRPYPRQAAGSMPTDD